MNLYCGQCGQECGVQRIVEVEKDHIGTFTTAEYVSDCHAEQLYSDDSLTIATPHHELQEIYFMLYD